MAVDRPMFQAPGDHVDDSYPYDDDYDDYDDEPRPPRNRLSPNFFRRENDGSVKLRFKLSAEEAALIEEAAGATPIMLYMHRVLTERAKYHIARNNRASESSSAAS